MANRDDRPLSNRMDLLSSCLENQDMRSEAIKFKPEVGKILMFPSYLKHFVYPF